MLGHSYFRKTAATFIRFFVVTLLSSRISLRCDIHVFRFFLFFLYYVAEVPVLPHSILRFTLHFRALFYLGAVYLFGQKCNLCLVNNIILVKDSLPLTIKLLKKLYRSNKRNIML